MVIGRAATALILTTLVIGIGLTAAGINQAGFPNYSEMVWGPISFHVYFMALAAGGVALISKFFKLNHLASAIVLMSIAALGTGSLGPVLATVWFAFASRMLGELVLRKTKIPFATVSNAQLFLVGAAVYGFIIGLCSHIPINYPGVYGLFLAFPILICRNESLNLLKALALRLQAPRQKSWIEPVTAGVAFFLFIVSLMPELGYDALVTHLFVPGHMLHRHMWGYDVQTYVWSVMPMLGDWLYSLTYVLGGETAARLTNLTFLFVLGSIIQQIVRWARGTEHGAKLGLLIFLTTPLTYSESSTLFIDIIWTAFVAAGTLSILKSAQNNEESRTHITVAALLLGAALAAKAVTFMILPPLLMIFVYRFKFWATRNNVRNLTIASLFFFVSGFLPYLTAWVITGNPVFPFFNGIFKSKYSVPINFEAPSTFAKGITWDALYQVTFNTSRYLEAHVGASGFQWLLMFVPALVILALQRNRRGLALYFIAVVAVILTFNSTAYLRYVLPSFAMVAAAIGIACSIRETQSKLTSIGLRCAVALTVILNLVFFESGNHYGNISKEALSSPTDRSGYLWTRLPMRNVVTVLNELNHDKTPVAIFGAALAAGINSDILSPSWHNIKFENELSVLKTSDEVASLLMGRGANYVVLDGNWSNQKRRELVEGATRLISNIGYISIREIDPRYYFQVELLKNPDFSSSDSWILSDPKSIEGNGVVVTVSTPAHQSVPVTPGRRYRQSAQVSCATIPTHARLQVNWINAKSQFIKTDIQLFDVGPNATEHSMVVTAPLDSRIAVVYASGHTENPVVFRKVSFQQ